MDWMLVLTQILQILKDFAITIAAIVGTFQGWKALKQWRLEMTGRDQYNSAKKVALKTIELADRLHSARARDWSAEYEKLFKEKLEAGEFDNVSDEEYRHLKTKLDLVHENYLELRQSWYEAKVCQIEIPETVIEEFFELRGRIAVSAGYVFRTDPNLSNKNYEKYDEKIEIINGVKDDEFGVKIETAKENVLGIVKEYLE